MGHPTGPKFDATSYDFLPYVNIQNWIGGEWVAPAAGGLRTFVSREERYEARNKDPTLRTYVSTDGGATSSKPPSSRR